jgi:hypothetical protein
MSPEKKRQFNTVFGGLFLLGAALGWGLAVYFALTPAPPRPAPVVRESPVNLASCSALLQALGYQASIVGNNVMAFEPLSRDPRRQLERSSLVVTACRLALSEFCMGEGCTRPGVSFTLARPTPGAGAGAASTSR